MAASTDDIQRLRRMTGEPTTQVYSNEDLATAIERYPVMDAAGNEPYTVTVGATVVNGAWTATYDLNAAAADIWDEKAATASAEQAATASAGGAVSEFTVAGASFKLSSTGSSASNADPAAAATSMARFYRSRRSPRTIMATRQGNVIGTVESN